MPLKHLFGLYVFSAKFYLTDLKLLLSKEQRCFLVTENANPEDIPDFYRLVKQGAVKADMICQALGKKKVHNSCMWSTLVASLQYDIHLHSPECLLAKLWGPSCPAQSLNTHRKSICTSSM